MFTKKKYISFSFFKINEYKYIKRIKDNLSKKFDKYDYNFKYRFIWIKFHKKRKIVKRKNIAKTTKTKYAITKI